MNTGAKVAIGAGAAIVGGIGAYYLLTKTNLLGGKYMLQTSVGEGGTISPSSPSGVYQQAGSVVTVTITANSGYTIGQVLEDGSQINTATTDTTETYQVTMDRNHTIDALFYLGGQPPVSSPAAINSLGAVNVWGYYGCKIGLTWANYIESDVTDTCDENFNYGKVAHFPMYFKVVDANGNSVPNVPVYLWPNAFPDASKYGGYLIINDGMYTSGYPAGAPSNSEGIVTINLSYYCDTSALTQQKRLQYDAGLWFSLGLAKYAPYNGGVPWTGFPFTGKGGHGITGQTPAMGAVIPNTVIAQIKNTNIQGQGLVYCGFNVKML